MIDKITPRPHPAVLEVLSQDGIEGMEPIVTSKSTFIAPFVNAERPEYLVIEDKFPSGRPSLDKAGVYLTDRDTVNKTERMKVTTCLNPLHTAMSMFGCLLGYVLICKEMEDSDIVNLVKRLGYVEGLPVVVDPGIISPKAFIDEVVCERLPNKFMPDDPRRIATDTSQKVGIRFGETIKSYLAEGRNLDGLIAIPLALAAWMRYLLGILSRWSTPCGNGFPEIFLPMPAQADEVRQNPPDGYGGTDCGGRECGICPFPASSFPFSGKVFQLLRHLNRKVLPTYAGCRRPDLHSGRLVPLNGNSCRMLSSG